MGHTKMEGFIPESTQSLAPSVGCHILLASGFHLCPSVHYRQYNAIVQSITASLNADQ